MHVENKYFGDIERTSFTIVTKKTKYLELNLTRNMWNLYDDNFKSFPKDTTVDLKKKKKLDAPFCGYDDSTLWRCQFSLS